jgi:carbonic anhydrase/acetyltransferase-like protein (isoleucine patch superfamily)
LRVLTRVWKREVAGNVVLVTSMPVRSYRGKAPTISASAYVDATALIIGDVAVADDASIWPMVVVRGDVQAIRIGARTNIQDGSVLHVTHASRFAAQGHALELGADITVGHRAILHGCRIGDGCLIGMAATVMDGAVLEAGVLLGAGSVVTPGEQLEGGHLWVGTPARRVRPLREEETEYLKYSAAHYVGLKNHYLGEA